MPASSRDPAGLSQRDGQHHRPISPRIASTTNLSFASPGNTTTSAAQSHLASTTRHRSASTPVPAPVHATSTAATVDLTDTTSPISHSNALIDDPFFQRLLAVDPQADAWLETLPEQHIFDSINWLTGRGVYGEHIPFDDYDEDEDEDYDYESDLLDFSDAELEEHLDETDEDEEEESEEDADLDEEDEDDFFNDDDQLALAEEEDLFVSHDPIFGDLDDPVLDHPRSFIARNQAFLDDITTNEFSSPSSYPPFIDEPSWQLLSDQLAPQPPASYQQIPPAPQNLFSPPSRTVTQLTNLSAGSIAATDDEDEDVTPNTSFSEDMPPTTRRLSHTSLRAEPPAKRRRTSTTRRATPAAGAKPEPIKLDDDLFGSEPPTARLSEAAVEDMPTIDLTAATEVPVELIEPVEDNRIKLAAFQCVICMDDVSKLTVTHCGHLYCAECLHSSIHTGATKGRCPMCRQKVETKPRAQYTSKSKGHWLLELKVMKSTRKGKRKAET